MSDNFDDIDMELAKKLDQSMKTGDAVELPFPVLYVWALNGQPSFKTQGGALYFGGWACKAEDARSIAEYGGMAVPADWKALTISTRDGSEYEAFTSRAVMAAPIGQRASWLLDGKRFPDYLEGGRRHVQVLAYLAEVKGENGGKQIIPWGAVVLTAKGYQARNLMDAFASWKKATSKARGKASPWAFYLSLGTFGKERAVVNVGKPGAQSPITPISCGVPETVDREYLVRRYVGGDVLAIMAGLQDQATEWLNAWKEPTVDQATGAVDQEYTGAPPDDEIPF